MAGTTRAVTNLNSILELAVYVMMQRTCSAFPKKSLLKVRHMMSTCGIVSLLLIHAALGLQRPAGVQRLGGRRAHAVVRTSAAPQGLEPPQSDLVLIDGDNVRGKTGFKLAAAGLVGQVREYAAQGQDAVLFAPAQSLARDEARVESVRVRSTGRSFEDQPPTKDQPEIRPKGRSGTPPPRPGTSTTGCGRRR